MIRGNCNLYYVILFSNTLNNIIFMDNKLHGLRLQFSQKFVPSASDLKCKHEHFKKLLTFVVIKLVIGTYLY